MNALDSGLYRGATLPFPHLADRLHGSRQLLCVLSRLLLAHEEQSVEHIAPDGPKG